MGEWKMYLDHGKAFYDCASGGLGRPEKFNDDALFNLTAMAIEKLSMGFLMGYSVMPEGHSFCNLVESMDQIAPLPLGLGEEIVRLDDFQESFCTLEVFKSEENRPEKVTRKDIPPMLETCGRLDSYIRENLPA